MTGSKCAGLVVQDRDRHLLSELGVMRIVDRESAKVVAAFRSTRRANARLLQLTRAGLLRRFFVGGVAHGRKAVYTLSTKGEGMVRATLPGISRASGRVIVGDAFVAHQSAINEIYLALKYRPKPHAGLRLQRCHTFRQPISDAIKLTPDGYFEFDDRGVVRAMFLEADLGTEALSVWQRKTTSYLQLAVSGEFQRKFHQPQFRVLVVASSERRLANIRATVAKSTDKIFWFTTFDIIHRDGFWSQAWLRPSGDQRLSLL
jgi:hypothetical protein